VAWASLRSGAACRNPCGEPADGQAETGLPCGTNPTAYLLALLERDDAGVRSAVTWAGAAVCLLLLVHYPAVVYARRTLRARWREERRAQRQIERALEGNPLARQQHLERRDRHRRPHQRRQQRPRRRKKTTVAGKLLAVAGGLLTHAGGGARRRKKLFDVAQAEHGSVGLTVNDRPPTPLHKFSNTHPRLLIFLLYCGVQGLARWCAYVVFNGGKPETGGYSPFTRLGAALLFCAWPLGFTVYTWRLIRTRVVQQRRCALVTDPRRTGGGGAAWLDCPPEAHRRNAAHAFYYSYVHSQRARAPPSTRAVPIARTCHTYDHTITESNVLFSLHPLVAYTAAFWTSTAPCSRISSEAVGACTPSSCSCATGWRSA